MQKSGPDRVGMRAESTVGCDLVRMAACRKTSKFTL